MSAPLRIRRRPFGRTLIELVIAMAIGMIIVIGVSSLYLSSSGLSRTANQVSTTEQTGQLALLMLGEMLKLAGYGEIVGSDFVADGQTLMDGAHLRGCTGRRFADPFPAYVAPPGPPNTPDLNCTTVAGGDALFIRYQAGPAAAEMLPAEANRITLRDCLAQTANQNEVMATASRAGSGRVRPMAFSVIQLDPANRTLDCRGNGGLTFQTMLRDVLEFRVFYRFDDVAFASGAAGMTHAAPMGGSIRDATAINALAGPVDPWNYVVAVVVCLTIQTNEMGIGNSGTVNAPRCPNDAAEAEAGVNLTTPVTDGRIRRSFSQVFTIRSKATGSPSITL